MDTERGGEKGTGETKGTFILEVLDPLAREILAESDEWAAYHAAISLSSAFMTGEMLMLPQLDEAYVVWSNVTDLFETGMTPIGDAQAALREAARTWLDRPGEPTPEFLTEWLERTDASSTALFRRDGDFWNQPTNRPDPNV